MLRKEKRDAPAKCGGCEWTLGVHRPGWLRCCTLCRRPLCRECLHDKEEVCVSCAASDAGSRATG